MRRAHYEIVEDDGSFYAEIPGFDGPYFGGEHQYMVRGQARLRVRNPHQGDIGRGLLARILRQAGISREEWERL